MSSIDYNSSLECIYYYSTSAILLYFSHILLIFIEPQRAKSSPGLSITSLFPGATPEGQGEVDPASISPDHAKRERLKTTVGFNVKDED